MTEWSDAEALFAQLEREAFAETVRLRFKEAAEKADYRARLRDSEYKCREALREQYYKEQRLESAHRVLLRQLGIRWGGGTAEWERPSDIVSHHLNVPRVVVTLDDYDRKVVEY